MPFPTGWNNYVVAEVDYHYVGAADITDFSLLVNTTDSGVVAHINSDGSDVRFSSNSGSPTEYPFGFIGAFSAGSLLARTLIPNVSHTVNTPFRIWKGNAGASDGQNKAGAMRSGRRYWPLEEDPTGGAGAIKEWSSAALHGTANNMEAGDLAAAKVGRGLTFDGSNEYVEVADDASLKPTDLTLCAIVKISSTGVREVLAKGNGAIGTGYLLGTDYPAGTVIQANANIGGWKTILGATTFNDGNWHHIAFTYDGTTAKVFLDGALDGSLSVSGSISHVSDSFYIGRSSSGDYWQGVCDEPFLQNAALSADELSLDYQNQFNGRVSFGSEQSVGGGNTTITTAAGNITLSGQTAGLAVARRTAANAGSLSLTGLASGLVAARKIVSGVGPFVWSGNSAALKRTGMLTASATAIAENGSAAALRRATKVIAAAGVDTLTGQTAGLSLVGHLSANSGSIAETGQAAALQVGRRCVAAAGSIALHGITTTLLVAHAIAGLPGVFTVTGKAATFFVQGLSDPAWSFVAFASLTDPSLNSRGFCAFGVDEVI